MKHNIKLINIIKSNYKIELNKLLEMLKIKLKFNYNTKLNNTMKSNYKIELNKLLNIKN